MKLERTVALMLLLLPGTGCASLTEAERDRRDYERANYEAEFLDYQARCRMRGKRMWISAREKVGRDGIPAPGDAYYCG